MADDGYSGVFGAFPYAFRRSESRLFRSYVLFGGLLAVFVAVFFTLALIVVISRTIGGTGGTLTFARSLFVLLALLIVAPLIAPVLFVARRHRRTDSDARYDAVLAATGYLFVGSLYLGAVASMPAEFALDGETTTRPEPSGVTAPIVELLYAMPETLSWTIPVTGAVIIYLAHRRLG